LTGAGGGLRLVSLAERPDLRGADREGDRVVYHDANVWVVHDLA